MTNKEKNDILALRKDGYSLPRIAGELNIPFNTVKSFLYRWARSAAKKEPSAVGLTSAPAESSPHPAAARVYRPCLRCGKEVEQIPHRKEKKFCSAACRIRWWNENAGQSQGSRIAEKRCACCGKPFRAYGNRKYCSHACYIAARFGKGGCV